MRKILICITSFFLFKACAQFEPYTYKNYEIGKVDSCNVGCALVYFENGYKDIIKSDEERIDHLEEIYYLGTINDILKLSFRKFTNVSLARIMINSNFMTVEYDLTKDRRLLFRDYEIEILKATPSKLYYKVLSDSEEILLPKPIVSDSLKVAKNTKINSFVRILTSKQNYRGFLFGETKTDYLLSADESSRKVKYRIQKKDVIGISNSEK